ncbi:DNA mismatch repair protein MutS [Fimbriimonas ginsengisoli]|uniref:DNA mismatch repair protein MutS n=1 Tax=Fimbriimonas ginsengisoli Gsoil 348 TaxID=661478 RepID=A0A068NTS6_FIMGI|nr:DNA mismatch repair protein MutS [Fimbriimonas ginsengisoli]AIE84999.1 DNA mismatch repair protein MutS [Fimbriimonas ginsengisoli Gsoil 348]
MTVRTPMLQQYFAAKAEHPGVLLAMRVGDFYEFYGEDAETAAAALEITLTGREDAANGRIPMAGVPFHSVEKYLARLLQKGLKVALCDQLEDPKTAKGLIKRGVTRVMTPGTLVEDSMLSAGQNNFLAAICVQDGRAGLALLDPSTGEFIVTEVLGEAAQDLLVQELARVRPTELLVGPNAEAYGELAQGALGTSVTEQAALGFDRACRKLIEQFRVANLNGFGCEDKPSAVVAASMILAYAEKNHLALGHVDSLATYSVEGFMRLDPATRRSLELTQNMADGGRRFTLLGVLDETVTAMGARLLRRWIEQPLLDTGAIRGRQEAVERFQTQAMVRGDLRDGLRRLSDLERLVSRAAAGLAGPRDLAALRNTLLAMPALAEPLRKVGLGRIQELREQIADHHELAAVLDRALVPDPPHNLREGGVIREGHDLELDKLRDLSRNGKGYIASLERSERERTGLNTLKVGYNSVFGYYLELSKAYSDRVPPEYIRKQTTANAERYITAELKEHESLVLGAEEKAVALESDLFNRLRHRVSEHASSLLQTARALAEIDVLATLSEVAARRGYVRPEIVEEDLLAVESGRHPVVEASTNGFVPNETALGNRSNEDARCLILTGPNMAGKSTYLRQNALIVLLAQIGSFVPAASCRLGLCDRIFARIGAKDELALGQSTFMVEMVESANILNHATERSLVILDEVGRGTSTYDGLAIAWAMIEHLVDIGAKTLFATHYHQLNALADQMPTVANYRVAVEEFGDDIVWTHRVLPGGTDRSYGIHVARMAGVPAAVLKRSAEILAELEDKSEAPRAIPATTQRLQLSLFEFEEPPVMKALQKLDVNQLTPIEALRLLDEWKRKFGR